MLIALLRGEKAGWQAKKKAKSLETTKTFIEENIKNVAWTGISVGWITRVQNYSRRSQVMLHAILFSKIIQESDIS